MLISRSWAGRHLWGATLEASGKLAGENATVRLQPCGQGKARLVGPDGKPVANEHPWFELVATPAAPEFSRDRKVRGELAADVAFMGAVDPKHLPYAAAPPHRRREPCLPFFQGHATISAAHSAHW